MSSRKIPAYIHGSKPKEQRRLSGMNDLLNQACLCELALTAGDAILDVGCGLGQFSRAMARVVGSDGRVVGIERDKKQLSQAWQQARTAGESHLVEWRYGDALHLPLKQRE